MTAAAPTTGRAHWTNKGSVRLFLWEKAASASPGPLGTILFVHGSSMASTPTFDLEVPGRPDASAMDHFARLGYDTWCVDMEGYGRSDSQYDGIASLEDLVEFFTRLPNPGKQFAVMPGIAHASFHQKNFRLAYHILHHFFSQPAPSYHGA